jgi:hypothetical protein
MRIRLIGHLREDVMPVGIEGPWFDFKNTLENFQNNIVEKTFGEHIDALIANSHSTNGIKECDVSNVPKNRRVLILWEPKIVKPKTYSKKILNNYGKIQN